MDRLVINGLDLGEMGICDVTRETIIDPVIGLLNPIQIQVLGPITFGVVGAVVFEHPGVDEEDDWNWEYAE
jgi:hypothetical protein